MSYPQLLALIQDVAARPDRVYEWISFETHTGRPLEALIMGRGLCMFLEALGHQVRPGPLPPQWIIPTDDASAVW